MTQFKEDVKEKVQNHPSNAIQGGIYVYVYNNIYISKEKSDNRNTHSSCHQVDEND